MAPSGLNLGISVSTKVEMPKRSTNSWGRMRPATFRKHLRAILSRFANEAQLETIQRLRRQETRHGAAMAPLSGFWRAFKATHGFRNEIGQKTGEMLKSLSSSKNIRLLDKKDAIEVVITPGLDTFTQNKVRWLNDGWNRKVKHKRMQRRLEIMAESAGIKSKAFRFRIGRGPFGVGKPLINPPRSFIGTSEKLYARVGEAIARLVFKGIWRGVF